jgi:hypothetical protein
MEFKKWNSKNGIQKMEKNLYHIIILYKPYNYII